MRGSERPDGSGSCLIGPRSTRPHYSYIQIVWILTPLEPRTIELLPHRYSLAWPGSSCSWNPLPRSFYPGCWKFTMLHGVGKRGQVIVPSSQWEHDPHFCVEEGLGLENPGASSLDQDLPDAALSHIPTAWTVHPTGTGDPRTSSTDTVRSLWSTSYRDTASPHGDCIPQYTAESTATLDTIC